MYNYDYIYHHGIKGQKWGVRRYQNKDGSLTPAGLRKASKERVKGMTRSEKKERRAEIKSTYKTIKKDTSFHEKMFFNSPTRKLAAKYVVDHNMSMSEARSKAHDVAIKNTVNAMLASAAIGAVKIAVNASLKAKGYD